MGLNDNKVGKRGRASTRTSRTDSATTTTSAADFLEEVDKPKANPPTKGIVINGQNYACASCKTGHRVGCCSHGLERPVKPSNPPGRPSAGGRPKKTQCDCPRRCGCTNKKNCKHEYECYCTQTMYILVFISGTSDDEDSKEDNGSWQIKEEVTTDLQGKILQPDDIEARKRLKDVLKQQEVAQASSTQPTNSGRAACCSHRAVAATAATAAAATAASAALAAPEAAIAEEEVAAANEAAAAATFGACNCGGECECFFCPTHPDNFNSRSTLLRRFAENAIGTNLSTEPDDNYSSCIGGVPQMALANNPIHSDQDVYNYFPNATSNGFILQYPVMGSAMAPEIRGQETPMLGNSQVFDLGHNDFGQFFDMQQFQDTPSFPDPAAFEMPVENYMPPTELPMANWMATDDGMVNSWEPPAQQDSYQI